MCLYYYAISINKEVNISAAKFFLSKVLIVRSNLNYCIRIKKFLEQIFEYTQ